MDDDLLAQSPRAPVRLAWGVLARNGDVAAPVSGGSESTADPAEPSRDDDPDVTPTDGADSSKTAQRGVVVTWTREGTGSTGDAEACRDVVATRVFTTDG